LKILIISNLFPPHVLGGYEILCGQARDRLAALGHEVAVLTSDHGARGDGAQEQGVWRRLKLYLPFDQPARLVRGARARTSRANEAAAAEIIRQFKPDIIFVWSLLRLTVGPARAAEASGLPTVYTFNDENIMGYRPAPLSLSPRGLARYVLDHWLFRQASWFGLGFARCTCISRLLKDNLLARGLPAADLRVIYQGIPIERFPLKAEPGRVGRPMRVLYAGQLHGYKGVHTLVEAAHRVAEARGADALAVTLAGDGPEDYKARLRGLAGQGKARVTFAGKSPHEAMPALYRDHDVFVFPSLWQEPFGLTHLEAMASGTPVASTAEGGQGEFLENGRNALVFAKEDAQGLAERLMRLADDPALARALALEGRRTVEERFTLDRYVRELEAWLAEAAAKR